MSNLSIRIPGVTFTNTIAENIPTIVTEAVLFHLFGDTEAKSIRNFVGSKAASSVVGTPTYPTDSAARLSNANGYEAAAVAAGQPFSFAGVVVRPPATGTTYGVMGTWVSGGTTNSLISYNGTSLRLAVDGVTRATLTVPASGVQFVAGTYDGTTAKIFNGVSAVLSSASAAYSGGAGVQKFRVGGSLLTGSETFDAHCAAYWKQALSDAEVQTVYEYFQREMARRDVTGV